MKDYQYIEYNNKITVRDENGFFKLENDIKAIQEYQLKVRDNLVEFETPIKKIEWLVDNDYYIDFFAMYQREAIQEIISIVYSYKFEFKSFMAISKFYENYSLKTNDRQKYLETYEDRIIAVSLYLAQGDSELAKSFAKSMIEQRYQPATPTFLNAGKKRGGELVSCFLLEMDDTLNSINYNINTSMQLSKIGGGIALNLSKLRGIGESIKGIYGAASGIMPVVKILEDTFTYVDQLGQRQGAGAVYLNVFHSDVQEFLDCKKINADEKMRIKTLSIGLLVPDKFFELAKNNEKMYLFKPYTVFKEYGIHLDDMNLTEMYDKLVQNAQVEKVEINSRDLLQKIAITQFESGYPYIIYIDEANRQNPLNGIAKIKMSNLCTEIFQIQKTSIIHDYEDKDEIGYDVSCNLGSLNIVNVMESKKLENSCVAGLDSLTQVTNLSNIKNAPSVKKANASLHSVGLGAMNLHGYFAKNKIPYESEDALDFVRVFFAAVNYYTLKRSCEIAKKTEQKFVDFEKSDYANGKYFDKYLKNSYLPNRKKITELFEGIKLPTIEDWQNLKNDVMTYGVYHGYRLAIAPTQSISYVQNATSSVMPVVDIIETRLYGDATTYYPMPYLQKDNVLYYKSAYNIDQMRMIDLISAIQEHVDQGISTILYVNNETKTNELVKLYYYAYKKGLKSLYYTRTKNLTIDECLSCAV